MLAFGSNQVPAGKCLGRRARLPTTAPGNGSGIRFASYGYSPTQAFCQPAVRVSAGALPVRCTGRVGRAAATGTAGGVLAKLAAQHRSGRAPEQHRTVGTDSFEAMASGLTLRARDCAAAARRARSGTSGPLLPGPPAVACVRSGLLKNFTNCQGNQNEKLKHL